MSILKEVWLGSKSELLYKDFHTVIVKNIRTNTIKCFKNPLFYKITNRRASGIIAQKFDLNRGDLYYKLNLDSHCIMRWKILSTYNGHEQSAGRPIKQLTTRQTSNKYKEIIMREQL